MRTFGMVIKEYRGCNRIRGAWATALSALILISLIPNPIAGAESPPTQESSNLNATTSRVDAALAAIQQSIGDLAAPENITVNDLKDNAPHRVFFIEGAAGIAPVEHPVLQHVRFVAQNYGLSLEHQHARLDDGTILFGLLLFEPFEMLKFTWGSVPFDGVIYAVADLCDVESLQESGGLHDVTLTEGAARRIERLSESHGQRRILTTTGATDYPFTWIPGLRTFPRLKLKGRSGTYEVEGSTLPLRIRQHTSARNLLREELGLPDDISWTIAEEPLIPRPRVFIAALHNPVRHGERSMWLLPALERGTETLPTWVELSSDFVTKPPWSRVLKQTPNGVALHWGDRVVLGDEDEENFFRGLSAHFGSRIALVVNNRVAGTAILNSQRPTILEFSMSPEAARITAAAWKSTGGVSEIPEQTAQVPEPAKEEPDTFQVRLMAEPQDRQYVPVTHFEAPGAQRGIQVAVRKEVILDGRAVTGVHLDPNGMTMHLALTPEALDALGGACFGNMGKQLAILYNDRLLCAPTIDEWEVEELSFKGMDGDWPDVAKDLIGHLAKKG